MNLYTTLSTRLQANPSTPIKKKKIFAATPIPSCRKQAANIQQRERRLRRYSIQPRQLSPIASLWTHRGLHTTIPATSAAAAAAALYTRARKCADNSRKVPCALARGNGSHYRADGALWCTGAMRCSPAARAYMRLHCARARATRGRLSLGSFVTRGI